MFGKGKMKMKGKDMEKADMPEMDPMAKEAKLGVLKHLSDMASEAMTGKLGGLKKVTVASDSKDGLKKGLDKAEELVEGEEPSMEMDESEEEMSAEPASGYEDLTPEEIEAKIQELMALKKKAESGMEA